MPNIISDILKRISPIEKKKIEVKMELASKIIHALDELGWSKSKFAEEAGKKNNSIITRWLSGKQNFTVDTLVEIQNILNIKLLNTKIETTSSTEISNQIYMDISDQSLRRFSLGKEALKLGEGQDFMLTLHSILEKNSISTRTTNVSSSTKSNEYSSAA